MASDKLLMILCMLTAIIGPSLATLASDMLERVPLTLVVALDTACRLNTTASDDWANTPANEDKAAKVSGMSEKAFMLTTRQWIVTNSGGGEDDGIFGQPAL